jgi:TonB family protein
MRAIWISLLLLGLSRGGNAQESAVVEAGAHPTENLSLELVTRVDPVYPREAEGKDISGEVLLKVGISESGNVETTQVISGDTLLANAAVIAANEWKFKPFLRDGKPTKISILLPFSLAPRPKSPRIIKFVPATEASVKPSRPSELSDTRSTGEKPVRVAQAIMQAFLVEKSFPAYPAAARQAKVQGTVSLKVLIGEDGRVKHVEAISGPEQLVDGAIETVRQWKYRPFMLDDKAVDVETIVRIVYQMAG